MWRQRTRASPPCPQDQTSGLRRDRSSATTPPTRRVFRRSTIQRVSLRAQGGPGDWGLCSSWLTFRAVRCIDCDTKDLNWTLVQPKGAARFKVAAEFDRIASPTHIGELLSTRLARRPTVESAVRA